MRTILTSLLLLLTIAVNGQDEGDAEKNVQQAVEDWIKGRLLQFPDTYSSIKFEEFEERMGYTKDAEEDRKKWLHMHHEELQLLATDSTASEASKERLEELAKLKEKAESHEDKKIGYKITHSFMGRNENGDALFYNGTFILDNDFTVQESVIREKSDPDEMTN